MMENLQQSWKQTTANLYKAVLIYTVAGIASSVFSFILAITATASVIAALSSGEVSTGGLGLWSLLNIAATVAIVYGYWLFIKSLDLFKGMVDPLDAPRIGSIRTATILSLVGVVLACIPLIGIVGGIINLVAWIMLLIAYSNLKDSATFPEGARKGASKIFVAMILGVIGWGVGWIPIVGSVIALILSIVAFCMILTGWKCIADSEAPAAR